MERIVLRNVVCDAPNNPNVISFALFFTPHDSDDTPEKIHQKYVVL